MKTYRGDDISIPDYVERSLDGSDHERGELETLRATNKNCIKFLAELISFLEFQGVLTEPDIEKICSQGELV